MTNTNISGVIIGVDTHKSIHVAVAIDNNGSRLTAFSAPATTKGYRLLEDWACALGTITAFGIEGTGSYGAGLSRHLLAQGHKVIEVTRPNRQLRYQHGKAIASTPKAQHGRCWADRRSPNPKRIRDPSR